jgi:hypothetical protein
VLELDYKEELIRLKILKEEKVNVWWNFVGGVQIPT